MPTLVLHSTVFQRWRWSVAMFFLWAFNAFAQFQAGVDFTHPFTILLNTDSAYYQTQSKGWFKFNTNGFSNVSGNAVTLKAALIPSNSRVILYDTVYLQRLTIYDSLQNIVFSDTIHHPWDTLEIQVNVSKNQNYWIQAYANYPCGTCEYPNEPVAYQLKLVGEGPGPQCIPNQCWMHAYFFNPSNPYVYNNAICFNINDPNTIDCFQPIIAPYANANCYYNPVPDCIFNYTNTTITSISTATTLYGSPLPTVNITCYFPNSSLYDTWCLSTNTVLTPIPYASTEYNPNTGMNGLQSFTICEKTPIYLYNYDNCAGIYSINSHLGPSCLISSPSGTFYTYGTYVLTDLNTGITYSYIPNSTPYLLVPPSGVTDFVVKLYPCDIYGSPGWAEQCFTLHGHIIPSPTVSIQTNTTQLCRANLDNLCVSIVSNTNSAYSYTTTITGPNSFSLSFLGPYTPSNPLCLSNFTVSGTYTIDVISTFNYSDYVGQSFYCNDTARSSITFTVVDCCINSKANNITISSATLVPYGTPGATPFTALVSGNVYAGLIAVPSNSTISNAVLTVQQNLNINIPSNTLNFYKCDILFSDGAALNITAANQVNLDRVYLHSCGIWNGISTASNLFHLTIKNSVIEDAWQAIFANNLNNLNWNIQNTLFNRNWIALVINNSKASVFTLKNSIFTSRNLNTALYNIVLSSGASNPPTFNSIFSPAFLSSRPAGLLHSSFAFPALSNRRGETGIQLSGINTTNISNAPIEIGVIRNISNPVFENATTNLFDFLTQGIVCSWGAQAQIFNCQFQNIFNYAPSVSQGAVVGFLGTNVYVGFSAPANSSNALARSNIFQNCKYGVHIGSVGNIGSGGIFANRFISCTNGIYLNTWNASGPNNHLISITQNTVTNNSYFTNVFDSHKIALTIDQNNITGGNYGVYINDVLPNANLSYTINNNTFRNLWYGVYAMNSQNVITSVNSFTIQMAPPNLNPPLSFQSGVYYKNTNNGEIKNNRIIAFPPTASTHTSMIGVFVDFSMNNRIYCNNIQQMGICIGVNGNSSSYIYNNRLGDATFPQSRYGIYGIIPGIIGDIEGPSATIPPHVANGNSWGWLTVPNIQYAISAIDNLVPWTTTVYYTSLSSPDYPVNTQLTVSKVIADVPNNVACGTPPNISNPAGIVPSAINMLMYVPNIPQRLGQIASRQTYRAVRDLNLQNTFSVQPVIQYETQFNTTKFYKADSLANAFAIHKLPALMTQAEALNNTIVPKDTMELIQQQFNTIYYKYLKGDSLITASDIAQLQNIAGLCPMQVGLAVYQARSLLKKYDSTEYINPCEGFVINNQRLGKTEPDENLLPEEVKIKVYPNPLKEDALTIESNLEGEWILYDVTGKEIIHTHLKEGKNTVSLNVRKGIYLYKVIRKKTLLLADKLIVE